TVTTGLATELPPMALASTVKPLAMPAPSARPMRACMARSASCSRCMSSRERMRPLKKLVVRMPPSRKRASSVATLTWPSASSQAGDFQHQLQTVDVGLAQLRPALARRQHEAAQAEAAERERQVGERGLRQRLDDELRRAARRRRRIAVESERQVGRAGDVG